MDYYYSRYFSPNSESTTTLKSLPALHKKRNSNSGASGVSRKHSIKKINSGELLPHKKSGPIVNMKTTFSGGRLNRNSFRPSMPGKDSYVKNIFSNSKDSWMLNEGLVSSGKNKLTGNASFSSLKKKKEPSSSKPPGESNLTPSWKSKTKLPVKIFESNKNNWNSKNCKRSWERSTSRSGQFMTSGKPGEKGSWWN